MNAGIFPVGVIDLTRPPGHTSKPMTPMAQGVIVLCVVVLSAVLVTTLLALRKTAVRAEQVLHIVEGEIRPMVSQLDALTGELRDLSKSANEEMKRVSAIVSRAEEVSVNISRVVGVLASLTRIGRYASVAVGLKKGLDAFVRRLKDER